MVIDFEAKVLILTNDALILAPLGLSRRDEMSVFEPP